MQIKAMKARGLSDGDSAVPQIPAFGGILSLLLSALSVAKTKLLFRKFETTSFQVSSDRKQCYNRHKRKDEP
jgi:hypothetical protein